MCPELYNIIKSGDTIQIDHENNQIIAKDSTFNIPPLSSSVMAILDAGGLVPMLKRQYQA